METQKDEAVQIKRAAASGGTEDHRAEKGAKNKTAEATEGPAPELPSSGPGRLKKTAMKLFGGKKGICTLPSFFGGGRSKISGKSSSKKGLNKSKTHDGLSEAAHGPDDIASEGTGFSLPLPKSLCQFPSSQSAHETLERGSRHKSSMAGATEKPGIEKVPSVHKPKKGLKGFFSSIRRHRKSKVAGAEQSEPEAKELEGTRTRSHAHVSSPSLPCSVETFQTLRKENAKPQDASGPKSSPVPEPSPSTVEKIVCKNPEKLTETCASELMQPKSAPEASSIEEPHAPETEEKVMMTGEVNPSNGPVGDQLSLLFGDVTSLKSFDSLTGCGDIIAEQDMDSMTDSMASGGQRANRDGTKRSSCLVTYQGGGEEMALPDDDNEEEEEEEEEVELEDEDEEVKEEEEDEDLEYLWAGAQMYPRPNLSLGYHPTTSPGHHGYMLLDPVHTYPGLSPGELLTPQSDQQESAPNSDEGYYDSTTPGFEDDSGEALGLGHRDCLPRDSYSGDALYEFYDPDDSLENSPPGDDCVYDLHGRSSEMFGPFLNFEPFSSRPPGAMETEEERLVTIQKQLLYWELRREQLEAREASTREAHAREAYSQEAHTREVHAREIRTREVHAQEGQVREAQTQQEKPILEYQMRPLGPSVMGLVAGTSGASQTSHWGNTSAFPTTSSSEPDWRDFRPLEKRFEGTCSKKDQSTCLMQLFQSDAMFEPDMHEANFGGSPRRAYPTYSPPEEPEEEEEKEGNATVSFSQALVEFTSNGNLFSSISCSSDSDSSFTQNLPELPPMVTFDIADVERDGEGKCEENPEFHNDEDLTASLEAFELGYYHKHAFNGYQSRFYQGLPWGVSSLPRYLGLPGIHSRPPPAAMALNRRSRSLDTAETLDLELSSSHMAQDYLESDELQAPQEDSDEEGEEEEGEWGRDSPLSLYTEPPGVYDWPSWAPCSLPLEPGPAWINSNQLNGPFSQSLYEQETCCLPSVAMPISSVPGLPRAPGDSQPQLSRPSHLPLPAGPCYNLQPQASQRVRARSRDVLLPSNEPSCSSISGGFCPSPLPQAKPVGITHGIPQLPRVQPEPHQPQPSYYRASSLDLSKERAEEGACLPASYSSTAVNGNLAK
uniref:APC membrane recruitment protein 1 n=1 Tax=Jaculus jaculus TaxID=51337 RepID=UPI0003330F46|nr:APC membrane recruitment protein 1 [Jaculus jaculus]XP_044996103.1 APC membrane recruitment protein 1 [Jaculus jaculus]XP_044996104.1 APC membrane recruitment protein 1 [Jaculus jaculus]XP_044996105.1 APC membrane recruitment protein 1 [Jaculus jaculus]